MRSMTISRGTLLHILGGTLSLVCLPGHLLHHGMTFLSGGWKTFLDSAALTFFIILVPGDWSLLVITPLLRYIIANLTIGRNISTNRSGCRLTYWPAGDGTLLRRHLLGSDAGN